MLENLVESKNNSKAARKLYGFLFSTFMVVATILLSAMVWSLFAKDFVMGNDDMSLSTLLTPIPVEVNEPKPEPDQPKQQNDPKPAKSELAIRNSVIARIDEVQRVPDKISTAPSANKARPKGAFIVDPNAAERDASVPTSIGRDKTNNVGPGFSDPNAKSDVVETVKTKVPPAPPALKKTEENIKPPSIVSLGVINGKANSLPIPPYPAAARAVGASGAVNVQVTINEQGSVISAKAVSGHPLLRDAAERAARSARFSPTYLSKVAVKVNGLIVYNFTK